MASPEDIASVRSNVDEPDETLYDDDLIGALIDANGVEESSAKIWRWKAARFTALVNTSEAGASHSFSDLSRNALAMAKLYGDLTVAEELETSPPAHPCSQDREDVVIPAIAASMHARQTEAFINQNPERVALRRRPVVADAAGGTTRGVVEDKPLQKVRLVGIGAGTQLVNSDGDIKVLEFVMVGALDLDVQTGDEFTLNGAEYRVTGEVDRTPAWGTRVVVRREGS